MSRLRTSALLLSIATGTVSAQQTNDAQWLDVDQELEQLAAATAVAPAGLEFSMLWRMHYLDTNYPSTTGGASGIQWSELELDLSGQTGDFAWHVGTEWGSTAGTLEEGYATYLKPSWGAFTVGRFKAPILRSAALPGDRLLFVDRSILGRAFDRYDQGIMAIGEVQGVHWMLAWQNGLDGTGVNHLHSGRVEWRWGGGVLNFEGAFSGQGHWNDPYTSATLGLTAFNEERSIDGDAYGFDFAVTRGFWYGHIEALHLSRDLTHYATTDIGMSPFSLEGSATPYSIAVGFVLVPEELEIAARYESLDDSLGTHLRTIGLNYFDRGFDRRFQVNVTDVDGALVDGLFCQIGIVLQAD